MSRSRARVTKNRPRTIDAEADAAGADAVDSARNDHDRTLGLVQDAA
ncbi:hypothetical protein SAMN04489751_0706 [Brevibacterium sandarakinum]|uniref:Uncharacterized protein n=1 Tax=Brevibacterium sandarakinum TaxID=629680 RepID=A0A1H1MMZ7_BRESA|nr:hypothetical protein SAMN04489751_0706 [Brevibacterium sandarakinum]